MAQSVILLHDEKVQNEQISEALEEANFKVFSFLYGVDLLEAWRKNRDNIGSSNAILMHKDLGDIYNFREVRQLNELTGVVLTEQDEIQERQELKQYLEELKTKDIMTCAQVLETLRESPMGEALRVILTSREYWQQGIRKESLILRADGGYDPTKIDGPIESRGFLPPFMKQFLSFGKVSQLEANTYRGKELVDNPNLVLFRRNFLEREGLIVGRKGPEG